MIEINNVNFRYKGTEDGGLNRFDPKTETFERHDLSGTYHNIQAILVDEDDLLVATFGSGLLRYNPARHSLVARQRVDVGEKA